MERIRSRQPSKSDLMAQTDGAIDPIKQPRVAQNPDEGETLNRDETTADVGECKQNKCQQSSEMRLTFLFRNSATLCRPNRNNTERRRIAPRKQ